MLTRIALIVTTRCDLHCAHCLRGLSDEKVDFPVDLLPHLLEEAMPFGARHVGFTSGEPYLHPYFPELVEMVTSAGYTWGFVSHGLRVEPYLPLIDRFRQSFTGLTLSLDGATREVHDTIRCKEGAYERITTAARRYVETGCQVNISASLNRLNMHQTEDMIRLAEELGACGINFGGTISAEGNEGLQLFDAESQALYKHIQTLREQTGLKVRTLSSLYTNGGVHFCKIFDLYEAAFNPRGELVFCCDTGGYGAVVGSLCDKPLLGLLQDWMGLSAELQVERAARIARGLMGEGFDTFAFCNDVLSM